MMKRRLTIQELRSPKTIHEIGDDHEVYFSSWPGYESGRWEPFDSRCDSFHTPLDCSSCYAWCESCIWSWVHDNRPRKPCDNGFAGYIYGRYAVQSCDRYEAPEHLEPLRNYPFFGVIPG